MGGRSTRVGLALLAVVAAGVLAAIPLWSTSTPSADLDVYLADRAMEHIEAIAQVPHPMGSEEIAEVRAYLKAAIEELGLEAIEQSIEAPDYYSAFGSTVEVVNVLARIPGSDSTGAVALVAHHDTVPETTGANDNSAAVATLLETARVIQEGEPLRNDLILLFTDGEEPEPRYGATAFMDEHPWARDVAFAINLEAIGGAGPSLVAEISGASGPVADIYVRSVPRPALFSVLPGTAELLGEIGTDFDVFKTHRIPGLNFAYLRGSSIYHTARDSIDSVTIGALQHQGETALGLAREAGSADLRSLDGGDAVAFTVGRWVIAYPDWVALIAAGGALAAVGLALRSRGRAVSDSMRGMVVALLLALIAAVPATLIWMAVAGARSEMGVAESYLYLAALLVLTILVWVGAVRFLEKHWNTDIPGGVLLVWALFALATAIWLPSFSYLFTWPVLGVALVSMWLPEPTWALLTGLLAASVATLVIVLPGLDIFFLLSTPRPGNPGSQLPETMLVVALLGTLAYAILSLPFTACTRGGRQGS